MNLTPEKKLEYLREYMHFWIDGWENGSFPEFRFQYYLSVRHRLEKRGKPIPLKARHGKAGTSGSPANKGTGIFLFVSSVRWKCCMYCGRRFDKLHVIETIDHIIAKSRGGLNGPKVLACNKCNGWKGNLSLLEFQYKVEAALESPNVHRPPGVKQKHLRRIAQNTQAISRCVLSKCGLDLYAKTQESP